MSTSLLARGMATLTLTAGLGLAGSVSVDAATTSTPSPAASATPAPHTATLATLKARCNSAIQRRLGTLAADDIFVKDSVALTGGDRTTLEGQIGADQQGLIALDTTIPGAAGGALQWMNRMFGLPETAGLTAPAPGWT